MKKQKPSLEGYDLTNVFHIGNLTLWQWWWRTSTAGTELALRGETLGRFYGDRRKHLWGTKNEK